MQDLPFLTMSAWSQDPHRFSWRSALRQVPTRWKDLRLLAAGLTAVLLLGVPLLGWAQGVWGEGPGQVSPELRANLEGEVPEKGASRVAPARQDGEKPNAVPLGFQSFASIRRTPAGAGEIVEHGQAPFPGQLYHFTNLWREAKDGEAIFVYAGLAKTEPGQGIVIVWTIGRNDCSLYRTPIRAGSLRVVGAEGERLTLATPSGATFVFDVPRRQFVVP